MAEDIETVIAAFTARLDRLEEVARDAGKRAMEWRSDGHGVQGGPFDPPDLEYDISERGRHTIVYDEGWPEAAEAIHMALHDPRSVLADIAAKRKILADYREAEELRDRWLAEELPSTGDPFVRVRVLEGVIRTLAGAVEEES